MAAVAFAPVPADAQALRAAVSAIPNGPMVVIEMRPSCASERIEISDGPDGPSPIHVVKSLCRALECGPGALFAVADPNARDRRGDAACCYILDRADQRVARIHGLSFAYFNVAASSLINHGWRPGQGRELAVIATDAGEAQA
ncbi:hypothetical protein [Brevundimonas faecalis]|uniref:Uncharacterized protein n=1 Tax=Brevundimonas faecalis TaxID=947378 RepID=A0ABV2RBB5_9CAUL